MEKCRSNNDKWNLITINSYNENENTKKFLNNIVRTTWFQTFTMVLVLLNALISASFVYCHDESDKRRKQIYYYLEVNLFIKI